MVEASEHLQGVVCDYGIRLDSIDRGLIPQERSPFFCNREPVPHVKEVVLGLNLVIRYVVKVVDFKHGKGFLFLGILLPIYEVGFDRSFFKKLHLRAQSVLRFEFRHVRRGVKYHKLIQVHLDTGCGFAYHNLNGRVARGSQSCIDLLRIIYWGRQTKHS